MKEKMRGIAAILMIAMLAACGNLLDPPQAGRDGGTGTVRIAIEGASAGARTLMPGPDEFTLTASFSGPGAQEDVVVTEGVLDLDLTVGSWTIAVAASTGTEPPYTEVGRGSATVDVARNQTVPANIVITPLTENSEQGDFSYSVTIPTVDSATLSLLDSTSAPVNGTPIDLKSTAVDGVASGTLSNLPAGYYFMNIRLEKGGQSLGRTEAAHIYKGLTTTAEYVFAAGDFDAVVDLIEYFWQDGEIPASGEKHYYRFPVTPGPLYGVWWNHNVTDTGGGDGTKTLDIGVTAKYESDISGDSIFLPSTGFPVDVAQLRRYIIPKLFYATSSDNIILEVAKRPTASTETGTFAIKYGEIKPLSAGTAETGTLAAGGEQWYSFIPATSTAYTVSWEDLGDQSGSSYTGDVKVTGFETVRNFSIDTAQSTADAAFNSVDSGYAAPQVLISASGSTAYRRQLIKVEAETGGSYAVKYTELGTMAAASTPLVAGVAQSGSIAAGEVKLYSISGAVAGDVISWEDSGDQDEDSTYTGDITVTAFYISPASTGHMFFRFDTVDSGYTTPQIFSSTTSTTYIKVAVKKGASGGTYSIKYQKP